MQVVAFMAIFLGGYVLWGCDGDEKSSSSASQNALQGGVPGAPGAPGSPGTPGAPGGTGAGAEQVAGSGATTLSALSIKEAEKFVKSWCGSGVLKNLRQLDADEYLVSDDMPAWLNVNKKDGWNDGDQEDFIDSLKEMAVFNAMLPKGKMILADFSSGSGCRNTLVAIDVMAAAYLKKLVDASSTNALTCAKKSKDNYHRLDIKAPSIAAAWGNGYERGDPTGCDSTLAHVLVGHGSTGTLTSSMVNNGRNPESEQEPQLFDFTLVSFIFEADGSAQFLRSDGAVKFFHGFFSWMYGGQ